MNRIYQERNSCAGFIVLSRANDEGTKTRLEGFIFEPIARRMNKDDAFPFMQKFGGSFNKKSSTVTLNAGMADIRKYAEYEFNGGGWSFEVMYDMR